MITVCKFLLLVLVAGVVVLAGELFSGKKRIHGVDCDA